MGQYRKKLLVFVNVYLQWVNKFLKIFSTFLYRNVFRSSYLITL